LCPVNVVRPPVKAAAAVLRAAAVAISLREGRPRREQLRPPVKAAAPLVYPASRAASFVRAAAVLRVAVAACATPPL
jgi:hypothetical protein